MHAEDMPKSDGIKFPLAAPALTILAACGATDDRAPGTLPHGPDLQTVAARRPPADDADPPPKDGAYRVQLTAEIAVLRERCKGAVPPQQPATARAPDLVEPTQLDPSLKLDVRYATTDNFLSARVYDEARVFLQRPAAEALVRAHESLRSFGMGLLLHDGYRPWRVTKLFWEATPLAQRDFVADPSSGSRHNRGGAIDLSLFDLATGRALFMPSGFDAFTEAAHPEFAGGTPMQRWRRDLLRAAMEAQGFSVYDGEWWHFDHATWQQYPLLDVTFAEIDATRRQSNSK